MGRKNTKSKKEKKSKIVKPKKIDDFGERKVSGIVKLGKFHKKFWT